MTKKFSELRDKMSPESREKANEIAADVTQQQFEVGCVNPYELEYKIFNEMIRVVCSHISAPEKASEPNYVNFIALNCGWLPLTKDEKMTVQYGGCEYEIVRKK
jgi:hypothetical protein